MRAPRFEIEVLHSFVDSLLGRLAIGSPFPSRNCHEPTIRDINKMVSYQRLSVFSVGVFDKRTNSGPGREDIPTTHVNIRGQIAANLVKDPVDLLLSGEGVGCNRGWSIGGASDSVTLPWEKEDYTTIRGTGIDQTLNSYLAGS